jgi:hypothetical protein
VTAGQLLAIAAVITAITALVTAVGGVVKMVGDLRAVRAVTEEVHGEVVAVKALVNGNHSDLVGRLDRALGERDEARAEIRHRDQTADD